MSVGETRGRILDSALTAFLSDGYEHTTIAGIRRRSGVSNGALFHHFSSKEAIADAIYVEAIESFQAGLWAMLERRPRSLRSAVRATIEHQLAWIAEHPDRARFVYSRGHLDWNSPAGEQIAERNRELARAFRDWMEPLIERGELQARSMTVVTAIVGGPAHAIAQRWLAGHIAAPLTSFVDELADAAWAGLRGRPAGPRASQPAAPATGHLTLELLADDDSVLARGRTTLELVPPRAATARSRRSR